MAAARARKSRHLGTASCTRFSPKRVWPAIAIVGQTSSAEKVLATATSLTSSGARLQSRALRAIVSLKATRRVAAPSASGGLGSSAKFGSMKYPPAFTQVESALTFIEFRGAAEFSCCAKRRKENPSQRKENPSRGKQNPNCFPSANRAFS